MPNVLFVLCKLTTKHFGNYLFFLAIFLFLCYNKKNGF